MKKDKKFLIGILASVAILSVCFNAVNAKAIENTPKEEDFVRYTAEAVFLLSMEDNHKYTAEDIKILSKYEDQVDFTDLELKEFLGACGFKGDRLMEAWAIVKKESMGNALNFNGNSSTGDKSYGLFQINMIGKLNADRKEKYNLDYASQLLNPVVNCQVAYVMSDGGRNWGPWKGLSSRTRQFMYQFPKN